MCSCVWSGLNVPGAPFFLPSLTNALIRHLKVLHLLVSIMPVHHFVLVCVYMCHVSWCVYVFCCVKCRNSSLPCFRSHTVSSTFQPSGTVEYPMQDQMRSSKAHRWTESIRLCLPSRRFVLSSLSAVQHSECWWVQVTGAVSGQWNGKTATFLWLEG